MGALVIVVVPTGCTSPGASDDSSTEGTTETTSAEDTGADTGAEADGCNGYPELCGRRYDQVVFPGTHNAHSARSYGFSVNANHESGLTAQLEAGARVLLMDVTYGESGHTALCHGPCSFGELPHLDGLAEISTFMEAHPHEVLTIIYQDDADTADIVADLETAGLASMVFTHTEGDGWPTLQQMIDDDTRLVVTAEFQGPPPAWFHHVWDLTWDTPYTFMSIDDMNCDLNRGQLDNELMLVNHWVNNEFNLPDDTRAAETNALDVLLARVEECEQAHGRRPTFLVVDWWETGDVFKAAAVLNGVAEGPS